VLAGAAAPVRPGEHEITLPGRPAARYGPARGTCWLEAQLAGTPKTVLLVSHDRELLNACAQRIVTVEDGKTWAHGGGFKTYAQARLDRIERLEELRRRWDEEHEKIKELVRMYRVKASHNDGMASRLQAAMTRLAKFEEAGPPEEPPREQHIKVRLTGARTGRRAVMVEDLAVNGTTLPFSSEIWYADRVAVLGGNGSGKSTFLRLLAGESLPHTGSARLGARVVPGMFAQTHARPDLAGRTPVEIVMTEHARLMTEAMKALARSRPASRPTRARCSPSRTTAGSPTRSTASWCSPATARCASPPSPSGTEDQGHTERRRLTPPASGSPAGAGRASESSGPLNQWPAGHLTLKISTDPSVAGIVTRTSTSAGSPQRSAPPPSR
jgi:energy-coupling factor transporter ATP-binding protein EcfA2